jgi:hypothetical protein
MMNNEDNDITLSNDKDISLMEGVRIKTADPSSDEGDVLRWYIYKEAGRLYRGPIPNPVRRTRKGRKR